MKVIHNKSSSSWNSTSGILMFCILVAGCGGNTVSPESEQVEPGAFSISRIQTVSKAAAAAAVHTMGQTAAAFNLGNVANTTDYFFVLTNAGDTNIENISIEIDHPGFQISPEFLDELPPMEQLSIHHVIRLTIIHGTSPSGVGNAPLLEPGAILSELDIKGTTTDAEGNDMEVELKVDLSVNAMLADLRLFRSDSEIDLTSPSGSIMNSRLYSGWLHLYNVGANEITVENSGNVTLAITTYRYYYPHYDQSHSFELAGGDAKTLEWPEFELTDIDGEEMIRLASNFNFKIDIGNTITDRERLPVQNDGYVYIVLSRN